MAENRTMRLAWFVCTGAVLFLFVYWALQVVFRPPNIPVLVYPSLEPCERPSTCALTLCPCANSAGLVALVFRLWGLGLGCTPSPPSRQTTVGCGGVKFVNVPEQELRTEL